MSSSSVTYIIAQLNFSVGAIEENVQKIIASCTAGEAAGADIVIFPEMALTGYPPEDLLFRQEFQLGVEHALSSVRKASKRIHAVVGHPSWDKEKCYNSATVFHDGKTILRVDKRKLPNYGVFDEQRYFHHNTVPPRYFTIKGIKIALLICADFWSYDIVTRTQQTGADIILSINASPFVQKKSEFRHQWAEQVAQQLSTAVLYVNTVGGQDEIVFDGASFCVDPSGSTLFQAPPFEEGLFTIIQNSDGSWVKPKQHTPIEHGNIKPLQQKMHATYSVEELTYRAIEYALADYVRKNEFSGVVLGLSGGIDSALVLSIAVDALGPDKVTAVMLPSRFTSEMSRSCAKAIAKNCSVKLHTISIEPMFQLLLTSLKEHLPKIEQHTAQENLQARIRGMMLMAFSNYSDKLLLTTGNKSELATGYATIYGDMAGGFAPLKDVYKTMVYKLAKWRNRQKPIIPTTIIERPPSAELAVNQKDEDSLPAYAQLDKLLYQYIDTMMPIHKIEQDTSLTQQDVQRIIHLIHRNEHKRRQGAIGPKVTEVAFGKDWRYPITQQPLYKK